MMAPNIATRTAKPPRLVMTKAWWANSRGRMIGEAVRRTCLTASMSMSSAAAVSPYVQAEFKANSLPPRESI